MEDDPKMIAAEIIGDMKGEKKEPAKADDDADEGVSAEAALKDMYGSMQSGDFGAAVSALKAAMVACAEDE